MICYLLTKLYIKIERNTIFFSEMIRGIGGIYWYSKSNLKTVQYIYKQQEHFQTKCRVDLEPGWLNGSELLLVCYLRLFMEFFVSRINLFDALQNGCPHDLRNTSPVCGLSQFLIA